MSASSTTGGSAGRSSILGLASSVPIIVANLASGVVTSRLLGPEGRAAVITATVWMILFAWISLFGLRQAIQYFLAPETDRTLIAALSSSVLIMSTAFGVFGVILGQGFVGVVIRNPSLQTPTRLMLCASIVVIWYEICCGIMLGTHRTGHALVLRISQSVVYLTFVGFFAVSELLTSTTALLSLGLSFSIPTAIGLFTVARRNGVQSPRRTLVPQLARYGFRVYPGSLATLTNSRIDLLIVPAVLSPAAVGFYGVASNTSTIMQQLLGNFALVLFPAMVASDQHRRRQLLERAVRLLLLLGLFSATIGSLLAASVIRILYGREFTPTAPLLQILLFAAVSFAVMGVLASGLAAHAMPARASVVNLVGVPATVVGLLVLVPRLGASGAALTSLAAYSLCLVVALFLCPKDLFRSKTLLSSDAWTSDLVALRQMFSRGLIRRRR